MRKPELLFRNNGATAIVRPGGTIDEDTDFGHVLMMLGEAKPRLVGFDLGGVTQINSCGVREWLLFIERVQKLFSCRFLALSSAMVEQANMIPNILGRKGTPVDAFFAPYFCQACDVEVMQELIVEKLRTQGVAPGMPKAECANCHGPLQLDAYDSEYLAFLAQH